MEQFSRPSNLTQATRTEVVSAIRRQDFSPRGQFSSDSPWNLTRGVPQADAGARPEVHGAGQFCPVLLSCVDSTERFPANPVRTGTMTDAPLPRKLTLDQFMKREGWVGTGGQAKYVIQSGLVRVNGEVETRRGRQMAVGDVVEFEGQRAAVPAEND